MDREQCGCGCDSDEEHEAFVEDSRRDFLRNPGPPPAHFTGEDVERALTAMNEARRELLKKGE